MNRLLTAAVAAATVALLVTGCPKSSEPQPVPQPNPTQIANKPIVEGPSGLRPNAPGPLRPVENGDGGDIDHLAAMSIADIEQFWTGAYREPLKNKFKPVNSLYSWNYNYKHGLFCGSPTAHVANAMWCGGGRPAQNCPSDGGPCTPSNNTIGWDRENLLPSVREAYGEMSIPLVLSHEYGHAISRAIADLITGYSPEERLQSEQQADCFAGVYLRSVVDGKSPRFTLSTADVAKVLAALVSIRDPLMAENLLEARDDPLVHGSAFERVTAFQLGFNDGVKSCVDITQEEIEKRREDVPKELLEQGQTGEAIISQNTVNAMTAAMTKVFSPADPPKISFDPPSCPDARPTPPASYCPATNTINVDMDQFLVMGTSLSRGNPFGIAADPVFGDYTPFSVFVSRYMLAVQKERGLSLDSSDAGLRTACLTGVASKKLSQNSPGRQLTGGDVDEAVSGLLTNGLAAGNVNGQFAPSAFARVDAFRIGVLGDEDACLKVWP